MFFFPLLDKNAQGDYKHKTNYAEHCEVLKLPPIKSLQVSKPRTQSGYSNCIRELESQVGDLRQQLSEAWTENKLLKRLQRRHMVALQHFQESEGSISQVGPLVGRVPLVSPMLSQIWIIAKSLCAQEAQRQKQGFWWVPIPKSWNAFICVHHAFYTYTPMCYPNFTSHSSVHMCRQNQNICWIVSCLCLTLWFFFQYHCHSCSQILTKHNNEVRALQGQLRETRSCRDHLARQLQTSEKKLLNTTTTLQHLQLLTQDQSLLERKKLTNMLAKATAKLEEKGKRILVWRGWVEWMEI